MATPTRRPHKATSAALHNGLTPEAALRRVAASCLRQLEANAPGALTSTDPEFVHQMRVALRRLRSAMRLLDHTSAQQARKRFGAPLRELGRVLGEQRNWDVFLSSMLPSLGLPAAVRVCALRRRSAARTQVRALIEAPAHAKLLRALAAWLARPVTDTGALAGKADRKKAGSQGWPRGWPQRATPVRADYARPRLARLRRRVKRGAKHFPELNQEARHRVRIDVKRLRYAVEAFGALFEPMAVRRYTAALEEAQDLLGSLTDIKTARALLGTLGLGDATDVTMLAGAQRLLQEREAGLLAQAPACFAGMQAVEGFWKSSQTGEHHV